MENFNRAAINQHIWSQSDLALFQTRDVQQRLQLLFQYQSYKVIISANNPWLVGAATYVKNAPVLQASLEIELSNCQL